MASPTAENAKRIPGLSFFDENRKLFFQRSRRSREVLSLKESGLRGVFPLKNLFSFSLNKGSRSLFPFVVVRLISQNLLIDSLCFHRQQQPSFFRYITSSDLSHSCPTGVAHPSLQIPYAFFFGRGETATRLYLPLFCRSFELMFLFFPCRKNRKTVLPSGRAPLVMDYPNPSFSTPSAGRRPSLQDETITIQFSCASIPLRQLFS